MQSFIIALPLMGLALAAPQPQDASDIGAYASGVIAEGFNGAAATYLAQEAGVATGGPVAEAFSAVNTANIPGGPTDLSQVNPTVLLNYYAQGATAVPTADRAAYSSVIAQAASLQGITVTGLGGAAAAATGAASSASGVASSAVSAASGSASSAAGSVSSVASHLASSASMVASSAGSAASSAAAAATSHSSSAAAAQQTMAVGMMAGMLAGVAGLAAAL